MKRKIYITQADLDRLNALLKRLTLHAGKDKDNLRILQEEVARAAVVDSTKVAPDVVTMHSQVMVRDLTNDEVMDITLVFPEEADIDKGRISVVAPIGAAILGYREGDTVKFLTPAGPRRITIEKVVFQPEAAGVLGVA